MQGVSTINGASARRRKFVLEYCRNGFRASAAAVKAGYSEKSARCIGSQLLNDPDIVKHIKELTRKHFKALQMDADETLARIAAVARADVRKLFDDSGKLVPIVDLDDDIARAIQSVEVVRSGKGEQIQATVKIKLEPRMPALQLIARHHRLVEDQPIVSVQQEAPIDAIDLARRVAFALSRAAAQTIESTPPVASGEAHDQEENEPPN
jgi:phage terminase small subunit